MRLQEIGCENCEAAVEWDGKYGMPVTCDYCGSTFLPAATVLEEVWMMTDPVVRARQEFDGRLVPLVLDIRFEVLRGQNWNELDRGVVASA